MQECIDHGKKGGPKGYAQKEIGGKSYLRHRLAYCAKHGVHIDSIMGQLVLHSCDNPRCVNPDHLRLGDNQENMDDKAKRRRGHNLALTAAQVAEIRATCVPSTRGRAGGEFTYNALARKFGVGPCAIQKAYLNTTHKFL